MLGIHGISKVIYTGIPDVCTIIVEGDTGSLKTTLLIETIKNILDKDENKICVFFSLKENIEFLEKRFNLEKYVKSESLILRDQNFLNEEIPPAVQKENIFKGISDILSGFQEEYGERLAVIAIDPINILFSQVPAENMRRNLYHFFSEISDLKAQNWVAKEKIEEEAEVDGTLPCHFLSDGIIELGMTETQDDVIRYMEIKKLRGVNHSLKRFQISYKKDGLKILGPAYEA